jgi:hypothetical protein
MSLACTSAKHVTNRSCTHATQNVGCFRPGEPQKTLVACIPTHPTSRFLHADGLSGFAFLQPWRPETHALHFLFELNLALSSCIDETTFLGPPHSQENQPILRSRAGKQSRSVKISYNRPLCKLWIGKHTELNCLCHLQHGNI